VPDVVGSSEAAASTAITDANLTVGTVDYQYSATVAAGLVISQNPVGGTEVAEGSGVNLTVSLGPSSIVPDVVGSTEAAASTAITDANLTVGTVTYEYSTTVAEGLVISQNPAGGMEVAEGSGVDFVVSLGPFSIVPDVVGLSEAAATTAITDANLTVGVVTYEYSDTVTAGVVISQNPAGGTTVDKASSVDLVVSLGKATIVPNVAGSTEAAATTAITDANLVVGNVTYEYSVSVATGLVISQNPAGGTEVPEGSGVDLVVSLGASSIVPDVVGSTEAAASTAITDANLTVGTVDYQYSATVAAGLVISQTPVGGTEVAEGSGVDLAVSLGPSSIVPDVVGSTEAAASSAITDANLTVGVITYEYNAAVAVGLVISQTPVGGTEVAEGSAVDFVVSLGASSVVPDVVGSSEAAASTAITDASLTVGTVDYQYSATVAAGVVISQAPVGGTEVAEGSSVDLVVSLGPSSIVPDVVGSTEASASTAITDANLVVGTVTYEYSNPVAAGLVLNQNPAGGAEVSEGSSVDLTVSLGASSIVPDVVGLSEAAASTAITDANLTVGTVDYQYSATVAAGLVISQAPVGGTEVAEGSAVDLVVSLGPSSIVPDVVGSTEAAASTAITDANLTVGTVTYEYSATVAAGLVISQNPVGGVEVAQGSSVELVMSLGKATIVPSVTGFTEAGASTAITDANLAVGTVTHEYSGTVAVGLVMSQSPAGGTQVAEGSSVDLVVSLGPSAIVPDVVGATEAAATAAITDANLAVGVITYEYSETVAAGLVISQNPVGGTEVAEGSSVDLVVSLGPSTTVPYVVGLSETAAATAITAFNLVVGTVTHEYSNTVAAGLVISQDPVGGTEVAEGSSVNLVVSLGSSGIVPDIIGQGQADANSAILAAGLVVGTIGHEYSNTVPSGVVLSQNPAGGTELAVGSPVDYVVSLGRPVVPDVVGSTKADAIAAIEAVDSLNAATSYEYHNTAPVGTVTSQNPVGGTMVDVGTIVNIVVSLGRPKVPGVVGLSESEAVAAIESVDQLAAAVSYAYSSTVAAGTVISQEPAGGTSVDVGTTVYIIVSLGNPTVPDVVGLTESEAVVAIEAVDSLLPVSIYQYDNNVPFGYVMSQYPVGGTEVETGTAVNITVSLGRPVVPGVVGQPEAAAVSAIEAVDGLTVSNITREYSDTVDYGLVISQNPAGGTEVPTGSTVDLVVSLGKPVVPDVTGLTETEAESAITAVYSLQVGTVSYTHSDTVGAGLVISQDPVGGTAVPIGSQVDFLVSLGPSAVPDVVGMTEAQASTAITSADLVVGNISYAYSETVPAGEVISQDPIAGTVVPVGSAVNLVISGVVVPDVVGETEASAESAVTGAGLSVGEIEYEHHDTVPAGAVIRQNPSAGLVVAVNSAVDLAVSLGTPTVPAVVGITQTDANAAILNADLTVGTVVYEYNDVIPENIVLGQSPAAATTVLVGSPVDLVVSLGQPTVPYVVGMSQTEAGAAINSVDSLGVGAVSTEYSDAIPADIVISQNPAGGTRVPIGSTVDLLVSLGQPSVPNVVGLSETDARAAITTVDNLQVGTLTQDYHNTVPAGRVISQNPAAGTKVPTGSAVDLLISRGRPVVPDVVGMTHGDAQTLIKSFTLVVGVLDFEYDDTVPEGLIISQNPPAGAQVNVGTAVDLVISFGKPFVPDVVGLPQAEANSVLASVTLVTGTVAYEYNEEVAAGVVISQNPAPDTIVSVGSAVDLVVSLGRPTVPDVRGMTDTDANAALADVTLVVGTLTYEYNDVVPENVVLDQNPVDGTVVSIGASIDLVLSRGKPVVPDVVGLSEADANAGIISVDSLTVGNVVYEYNDTIVADTVMSQQPSGGTAVLIGSTVELVVSLGKPVVTDVVGMTHVDANEALADVTCTIGTVTYEYDSNVPGGVVLGQDPPGGTVVTVGSTVDLVVSLAVVPDIVGLSKYEAYVALSDVGLVFGVSTYEYSDTIAAATVMTQNPAPGTRLPVGSPIDVLVSSGQPCYSIVAGGLRLSEVQNNDGGWDVEADDGDPNTASHTSVFGSAVLGLIQAYRVCEEPNMPGALQQAKTRFLSKTDNFVVKDGLAAAELDRLLGGADSLNHVRVNFYDKLAAGTYYDSITDANYDTGGYIHAIRVRRVEQGIANCAAWDIGVGLYGAYTCGAETSEWVSGVKAEIDELDGKYGYDVLGLAGAVLGLTAVGEDYDPQAGEHEAASSLSELGDILTGYQLPTGGFSWHNGLDIPYFDEAVLETSYGLLALAKLNSEKYMTEISDASNFLRNIQLTTGGWENFIGFGEENEMTGEAVRAIVAALPPLCDFNDDGKTDLADFAILASVWRTEEEGPGWIAVCDVSDPSDGIIDENDLDVFVEHWLEEPK